MQLSAPTLALAAVLLFSGALHAETPGDNTLVRIEEGRVYRVVNGQDITGREVLDVLAEEAWNKYLQPFIEYSIRNEEAEKAKVVVTDAEVDEELALILKTRGGGMGGTLAEIQKNFGGGVVDALRRSVRADLGILKIFQGENKLPAGTHTTHPDYLKQKKTLIEKRVLLAGVVTDPKELGSGEAVRIGPRSYSREEVRRYILEAEGQIPKSDLLGILSQLELDKLVRARAAEEKLTLSDDDRNFHFSYLCRLKEQESGIPGRAIMIQVIQSHGMTPDQYIHSRVFSFDALATLIVKEGIKLPELRAEYALNPDKYKLSENLTAHIFIQVLDPDGHPYGPNWETEGHPAVNAYAREKREEQFKAAEGKIDGLVPLAKANFDDTARKFSEDNNKSMGGLIGRLGRNTIPARPLDMHVLEAATKLKPGEISAPIRSDYGWHILKCLEKQDVSFEEVGERVFMNVIQERRRKLIETLLQTAKIEDKF